MSDLSIGIVGTGEIGSRVHLPVLLCADGLRVSWVTDKNWSQAKLVAQSFDLEAVELPDTPAGLPDADIILLAIPYGVRAPYIAELGRRGAAVYVEKPFALTVEEHDGYAQAFAPERLAVGYKFRATAAVGMLRKLTAAGVFGALREVRVAFGAPGVSTGGRYSSSLAMAGGGVLFEVGCHYLDLALYVADAQEVVVAHGHMIRDDGFDLHTEAEALATTPSGSEVRLNLVVTSLHHTTMDVTYAFEHADVVIDTFGDGIPHLRTKDADVEVHLTGPECDLPRTAYQITHAQWLAFADAVRTGTENYTSASTTRVTTSLVEQLYALPEEGT